MEGKNVNISYTFDLRLHVIAIVVKVAKKQLMTKCQLVSNNYVAWVYVKFD